MTPGADCMGPGSGLRILDFCILFEGAAGFHDSITRMLGSDPRKAHHAGILTIGF